MSAEIEGAVQQQRTLSWRHGFAIALGVPVLILPSISTFSAMIGAFAIVIWMFSVFHGFLQITAYGELASRYPNAIGIPGFVQAVFRGKAGKEYGVGKFIGGFCAWNYWFTWNAVLSVFAILIANYLIGIIPAFADYAALNTWFPKVLSLCVGVVVFSVLILINYGGFGGGAIAGYILAALSLIPLFVISLAGFFSGHFELTNITQHWFPDTWTWDLKTIVFLFGIMALAQWSACGFEAAAIYAPQYKKPRKDIPKALFGCGVVCIFAYFLVQTACTGALGIDGLAEHYNDPMLALAKMSMGNVGAIISIIMLLAAMVMIIQTAILGSGSAIASLAEEGNIQKIFGKRNKFGVPIAGMITVSILNLGMIALGDSANSILAAAAIGYVLANGLALFAYVKAHRTFKNEPYDKEAVFRAPRGWVFVAGAVAILQIPFYVVGTVYLNITDYGVADVLLGVVIIMIFIPLWLIARWQNTRKDKPVETTAQGIKS